MLKRGQYAVVTEFPACDICGKPARYDGVSKGGPWGYFCEPCWVDYRRYTDLGVGKGQKLLLPQEQPAMVGCPHNRTPGDERPCGDCEAEALGV